MIQSESIIRMLEIYFNKNINDIKKSDLDQIKNIVLERIGYDGNIQNVNYDDLLQFKNLEELNVYNCMIDKKLLDNLMKLNNIKIFNAYACDFIDGELDVFYVNKIKNISFMDCIGLQNLEIKNIDELFLKNTKIKQVENVNVFKTDTVKDFKINNINNLIIINDLFDNSLLNKNIKKITIIDEKNEIVKEILK